MKKMLMIGLLCLSFTAIAQTEKQDLNTPQGAASRICQQIGSKICDGRFGSNDLYSKDIDCDKAVGTWLPGVINECGMGRIGKGGQRPKMDVERWCKEYGSSKNAYARKVCEPSTVCTLITKSIKNSGLSALILWERCNSQQDKGRRKRAE